MKKIPAGKIKSITLGSNAFRALSQDVPLDDGPKLDLRGLASVYTGIPVYASDLLDPDGILVEYADRSPHYDRIEPKP